MKFLSNQALRLVLFILLFLIPEMELHAQNALDLAGLNSSSPAYVAFSMRRLSTAYNGSAIQIRRSSDNTTQDIGFTGGGDLNVTSLMTFVGGGSGFVSIWYDQSGNGRNMTQPTAINQPRIVNTGTLDIENNKPFIRFFKSGTYNSLQLPTEMSTVGMVSTVNKFAPGARGFLLGHSVSHYNWHDQPPRLFATYASTSIVNSLVYQNGTRLIGSTAVWNSTLMVNTILPKTPLTGTNWDNIGRDRSIYNHTEAGGGHTELIAFSSAPSSLARTMLEKNQGAYYSIAVTSNYVDRTGALIPTTSSHVNKFGKLGVSSMLVNGETSAQNLPDAPTTTNLALTGASTANLTVTMNSDDGAGTTVGICWGTRTNPTIADSKTNTALSSLSSTATMISLTSGTTYFVRSYATNALGTTYGNEITFTHLSPGYVYQGGKVAYIYQPNDPGYIAGEVHGLIATSSDLGTAQWGCSGTNITGSEGTILGTGSVNTDNIVAQCGTVTIAARLCANYSISVYSDWFLPSIDELGKLFNNRIVIGGFSSNWYWSSTESTSMPAGAAQMRFFSSAGSFSPSYSKSNNTPRVRATRYF